MGNTRSSAGEKAGKLQTKSGETYRWRGYLKKLQITAEQIDNIFEVFYDIKSKSTSSGIESVPVSLSNVIEYFQHHFLERRNDFFVDKIFRGYNIEVETNHVDADAEDAYNFFDFSFTLWHFLTTPHEDALASLVVDLYIDGGGVTLSGSKLLTLINDFDREIAKEKDCNINTATKRAENEILHRNRNDRDMTKSEVVVFMRSYKGFLGPIQTLQTKLRQHILGNSTWMTLARKRAEIESKDESWSNLTIREYKRKVLLTNSDDSKPVHHANATGTAAAEVAVQASRRSSWSASITQLRRMSFSSIISPNAVLPVDSSYIDITDKDNGTSSDESSSQLHYLRPYLQAMRMNMQDARRIYEFFNSLVANNKKGSNSSGSGSSSGRVSVRARVLERALKIDRAGVPGLFDTIGEEESLNISDNEKDDNDNNGNALPRIIKPSSNKISTNVVSSSSSSIKSLTSSSGGGGVTLGRSPQSQRGAKSVSFLKFLLLAWDISTGRRDAVVRYAFAVYDKDGDGCIGAAEGDLQHMFSIVYRQDSQWNKDRALLVKGHLQAAGSIGWHTFAKLAALYEELLLPLYRVQSCFRSIVLGEVFWDLVALRRYRSSSNSVTAAAAAGAAVFRVEEAEEEDDGISSMTGGVTAKDLMLQYGGNTTTKTMAAAAPRRRHTITSLGKEEVAVDDLTTGLFDGIQRRKKQDKAASYGTSMIRSFAGRRDQDAIEEAFDQYQEVNKAKMRRDSYDKRNAALQQEQARLKAIEQGDIVVGDDDTTLPPSSAAPRRRKKKPTQVLLIEAPRRMSLFLQKVSNSLFPSNSKKQPFRRRSTTDIPVLPLVIKSTGTTTKGRSYANKVVTFAEDVTPGLKIGDDDKILFAATTTSKSVDKEVVTVRSISNATKPIASTAEGTPSPLQALEAFQQERTPGLDPANNKGSTSFTGASSQNHGKDKNNSTTAAATAAIATMAAYAARGGSQGQYQDKDHKQTDPDRRTSFGAVLGVSREQLGKE